MMLSVHPGETLSKLENDPESVKTEESFDNDYILDTRLRSGSYGIVYTTRHKKTNEEFAVKIINRSKLTKKCDESTFREIRVMKSLLDIEHVVRLVDVYISAKSFHIVQIYASGGDVLDRLARRISYSEMDARALSTTLVKTISAMHSRRLCHRDLKPENLLLKDPMDDNSILLADFGFTKFVPNEGLKTKCGTPAFIAPEIVCGKRYDTQADMWGVGCIIYMLISGLAPFRDRTHRGLFRKIRSSNFTFHDSHWENVSLEAKQLITSLLIVDPDYRPTADESLSMSWFKQSKQRLSALDLSGNIRQIQKFTNRRSIIASTKEEKRESKIAESFNVECLTELLNETDEYEDQETPIISNSGRKSRRLNLSLTKDKKFSDLYTMRDQIQRGSAGLVKKCYSESLDREFAVKIIERNWETDEQVLQEVSIMNNLDHEHILGVVDFFEEKDLYYIVMELMEGGDVFDRILSLKNYTESDARDLAKILLEVVDEMHQNGIAHRDIKPQNILLKYENCNSSIKVGDFGFAKRVHTPKSLTVRCGTPSYIAPEILKNQPYDQSCDMWSVGVVIYVMLCGNTPFRDKSQDKLFERIKLGEYKLDPRLDISEEAKRLLRGLMCINPDKRLTAKQALRSEWIKGVSSKVLTRHSLENSRKRMKERRNILMKDIACAFKDFKKKAKCQFKKEKTKLFTSIEFTKSMTKSKMIPIMETRKHSELTESLVHSDDKKM
eukprot:CAMPEP_0197187798 /NCGR_PEP_ID=MMETSP1423-20130617/16585_1 /TAXON_ID=476441 /ORGANISM="Pseudo-nitzschia heimii, Strain UNC1101" /LENGTH=724 /DNA_ID=CAMNT_0042639461 /DNA_START=5 /DNA_END=2179 /DNA_ORIENTATION=+